MSAAEKKDLTWKLHQRMAKLVIAGRSHTIERMLENPDELLRIFPVWQMKRMTGNRFLPRPGGLREQDEDELYNLATLDGLYEQVKEVFEKDGL